MATVAKEARYILTNIENNNNKFWNILLFDDGTCETQWGRVGEEGQSKRFPAAGIGFFESKCREKAGKGYKPQKTLGNAATSKAMEAEKLAEVAQDQIRTNSPETMKLVSYLAQVNVHSILQATTLQYDTSKGTFSTPLGILTADAIAEARRLLTDIGSFVYTNDHTNPALVQKLNDYLMLVPQNIGRGRPDPKVLYPDLKAVQAQNNILDSLEASLQMVLSAPKNPQEAPPPKLFEARLDLVEDGRQIDRIRAKYRSTLQKMHACSHLDVKRVFSVEIGAMQRDFENMGRKIGNIQELWHGTKASNLLSILKVGFYIPPTSSSFVTGRMFGNGVYFSDQSTKSLNYAYGYWSGKQENNCFMFLNDVAMGREFLIRKSGFLSFLPQNSHEALPKPGYDSTFAKAGYSGVMNNEMIVYRTQQINPKYLIEFSPAGR